MGSSVTQLSPGRPSCGVSHNAGPGHCSKAFDVTRGESVYFVWDPGWDGLCDSGVLELTVAQS